MPNEPRRRSAERSGRQPTAPSRQATAPSSQGQPAAPPAQQQQPKSGRRQPLPPFKETARPLRRVFGAFSRSSVQSLAALGLLALVSVLVGWVLGASADRLESMSGLLMMVPAAIALRGNIFGALGSRLGTAIHSGTYRLSLRPASVMGENVIASLALSLASSAALALLAKAAAWIFGIADAISLGAFMVISILGGLLASLFVLIVALVLAAGSARFGWDPDNVTAPLVTATSDAITLPALLLVVPVAQSPDAALIVGSVCVGAAVVGAGASWSFGRASLRTILRESFPVLVVALMFDLAAGLIVEQQVSFLGRWPALLVLLPGYLALAGALGGILSSRLASKLHLGLIEPTSVPSRDARRELSRIILLSVPAFASISLLAHGAAVLGGLTSPGLVDMLVSAVLGGVAATAIAVLAAYYGTIAAERVGLDPDTFGIPLVTSSMDLAGALTLVGALGVLGVLGSA